MTTLTRRQQEVCTYLCRGWSNKELATHMDISVRTVETHREEIFKKYGARNMVEVVRKVYGIEEMAG